jgi:uncharacterized protein (TIGR02099 family)
MQATTSISNIRLRIVRKVLKWLLIALLAAWTAVASVYLLIHAVIVPRIDIWRSDIALQLSVALDAPVQIASLSAKANNWTSYFEARDVLVGADAQRPDVFIPKLQLSLSMRGLWRLEFDQLRVTSPSVRVLRDASGAWRVAGMVVSQPSSGDTPGWLDWVFEQPELMIEDAIVEVQDHAGFAPTSEVDAHTTASSVWLFRHVDAVLRSGARSHEVRIDFTPPPELGQRVSLQAEFDSPLFSTQAGNWRDWEGLAYAQWPQLDGAAVHGMLTRLWPQASDVMAIQTANMAWRGWLEWGRGAQLKTLTSDVALAEVGVVWRQPATPALKPLLFKRLQARLTLDCGDDAGAAQQWQLAVKDMSFETVQGVQWDGAQLDLSWPKLATGLATQGQVRLARLDVDVLRQLAPSLPMPEMVRNHLNSWRPTGYINSLQADWRGAAGEAVSWHTSGQATELGWAPGRLPSKPLPGDTARPGVRGLSLTWDGTRLGGTAQASVTQGSLVLPGIWREPEIALSSLVASLSWAAPGQALQQETRLGGDLPEALQGRWRVAFENVQIDTPHGHVSGAGLWAATGSQAQRQAAGSAGFLKLDAAIDHLPATQLARYLPSSVSTQALSFLNASMQGGQLSDVAVRINSELDKSVWDGGAARFAVSANAADIALDYAAGWGRDQQWPALNKLSARFVMNGSDIDITNITGRLRDAPGVVVSDASVGIRGLDGSGQLTVDVVAAGPLPVWLAQLNATPIARWSNGLMQDWQAGGDASLRLRVDAPLGQPEQVVVTGQVALLGNSLQLWPGVPALQQATARVQFSNDSVEVTQARGQWLGSPVSGSLRWQAAASSDESGGLSANVRGTLNAEALARTPSLGIVAKLAQYASGSTPFEASAVRDAQGLSWQVEAPLTNMRLNLPQPINKPTGVSWPLRLALSPAPANQRSAGMASAQNIVLRVGPDSAPVVHAQFIREFTQSAADVTRFTVPAMVRGAVGLGQLGDDVRRVPDQGVLADVRLAQFNVDHWRNMFSGAVTAAAASEPRLTGVGVGTAAIDAPAGLQTGGDGDGNSGVASALKAYMPTTMVARALELTVQGRSFHNVVLGAERLDALWRANVKADEVNGYLQYREPDRTDSGAGNVYARLAMLSLKKQETQDFVQMLTEQPRAMPALDVVVQSLNLEGRDLGRLELQASNRVVERALGQMANEWRLNRLWLDVPEASLRANGQWAPTQPANGGTNNSTSTNATDTVVRRTFLDFDLELRDGGALLSRFGMPGVVRGSEGRMTGQVAWVGAPTSFNTRSLSGALDLKVSSGQFLKADPGIAKLLGVLSLQSLPRRLLLDFRDVFLEGFAFDEVVGNARITTGVISTNNLRMAGVNATVLMEGEASMTDETQALQVVVVPQVDAGTLSLLAAATNPVIGVATYFLERVFGQAITTANTKAFQVTGSWQDPQVDEVKLTQQNNKAPVQTINISKQASQALKQFGNGAATVSSQPDPAGQLPVPKE